MTQLQTKLSKRIVDAAQPASKDYVLWDDELPGFGLRVYVSGKKSYLIQYRHNGQSRRYTIGLHGKWTPDAARNEAKIQMGRIAKGDNPAEERAIIQRDPTINELCDLYLKEGPTVRPHKKASSWQTDRRAIARHIRPMLGNRKLASLAKIDVQRFQADITAGKTAMKEWTGFRGKAIVRGGPGIAARTTALLRAILNFAVDRGLRADNPASKIQLHKTRKCERFLSSEELTRLGQALSAEEAKPESKPSVAAIRLLVFTGCRKSEILTLRWRFIDWEQGLLRLIQTLDFRIGLMRDANCGRRSIRFALPLKSCVRTSWRKVPQPSCLKVRERLILHS